MTSEHPAALAQMKADVWQLLQRLPGPDTAAALHQHLAPDAVWVVSHPFNELVGPAAVAEQLYAPLQAAFPDLERRADLFFGGEWISPPQGVVGHSPAELRGEGWWATSTGHYVGTFKQPWLGIAATGEPAALRFGEFYRWQQGPDGVGRITEARVLLDIVDLARQAGRRMLPESSGLEWLVPGPAPHDGLLLGATDPALGAQSMRLTLEMFNGLWRFDGKNLDSMDMPRYWHPNMMWYGPGGIGSMRGVGGFQRHHQAPFLHAFPDRGSANHLPRGHRARIAEGPYVGSTGWPSVRATFTGDYLGVKATGKPINMRVMDWWRNDGTLLTENWVMIDLPHLMLQMDVDLLARLHD
ncbi:MAG: ester cyclase [Rubrivivax sp.]|nr:ester cyclase [Rubrivivax sp.]